MKSLVEQAQAMSERANKNEPPGEAFTVKQAISRTLHARAANLHKLAEKNAVAEEDKKHHEKMHKHHFDLAAKFNIR